MAIPPGLLPGQQTGGFQPPMGFPPFPPGIRPPLMPVPPPPVMMMPGTIAMPPMPPTLTAPPLPLSGMGMMDDVFISAKPYTKPVSVSDMKANTTVFVGNITDKANDSLVRQILLRCGYIVGWKRVQNATGKLQAFGFCEFADPECTLRAMRLLNNFNLGDKNLVVKVDSKNKKELLKYLARKKRHKTKEAINEDEIEKEVEDILSKGELDNFEEELDEEMKQDDKKILDSIYTLVKENIDILSSQKTSEDVRRERDVHESLLAMAKQSGRVDEDTTLDDMDMEDDMKTLVSDEIKKFRQSYQDYEEKQAEARIKRQLQKKSEKNEKDRSPKRDSERVRSPARRRSRSPRTRSPRRGRSKSPRKGRSRSPRTKSQERRDRIKEREKRKKEEKERNSKEEEEYEQRQMERKRREREKAYQERLKQWENRAKRKLREYEFQEEEEEERREKREDEKKCLSEFLEDYDDDKDDSRYYKGNAYSRRRNEREMEKEEDERDRKREKEEIETLRLEVMERQIRELEEEQERKKNEEESRGGWTHNKPGNEDEEEDVVVKSDLYENVPLTKPGYQMSGFPTIQVQAAPAVNSPTFKPEIKSNPNEETSTDMSLVPYGPPNDFEKNGKDVDGSPYQTTKLTFGLSKKQSNPSRVKIDGVFGGDEDQEDRKPKKKLYTLVSSSRGSQFTAAMAEIPHGGAVTAEDRKKLIQSLVNSIPSKREELFNWDLKWNQIDQTLMEKRVGPWINKKIVEYIGEPEPTLTEFICNKLAEHVSADGILKDIAMVLDDEAEVFVLKLWRLLIYETEARHLGIAKNY